MGEEGDRTRRIREEAAEEARRELEEEERLRRIERALFGDPDDPEEPGLVKQTREIRLFYADAKRIWKAIIALAAAGGLSAAGLAAKVFGG